MMKSTERGFTLVEIAFVLIMWGGIMAVLFSMYAEYRNRIVLIETTERLELNAAAITSFANNPKRYPCPSAPGLAENDPDYGREMCAAAAALPLGTCSAEGLCHVLAARDVDGDPGNVDTVYIGGVPFMDLQEVALADGVKNVNAAKRRTTYDGWGGAFTYAVSANLTDDTTFNNNNGGISVVTEWGDSIVTPTGSADFLLVSHGRNMRGAYNQELVQGNACAGLGRDISNCAHDDAEFVNSLIYRGAGATFFDDYVYVYQAVIDGIWEQVDEDIYYKGTGNLGVGVDNPTERLEVDGRVYGDDLNTREVCDPNGDDCFEPQRLGGTLMRDGGGTGSITNPDSGMGCDDVNDLAVGIENNQFICDSSLGNASSRHLGQSCPAGFFMRGFDDSGGLICESSP